MKLPGQKYIFDYNNDNDDLNVSVDSMIIILPALKSCVDCGGCTQCLFMFHDPSYN